MFRIKSCVCTPVEGFCFMELRTTVLYSPHITHFVPKFCFFVIKFKVPLHFVSIHSSLDSNGRKNILHSPIPHRFGLPGRLGIFF